MDLDYVQGKGKGKPSNSKQLCCYCNKPGHIAKDCRLKQSESSSSHKGSKGKPQGSKGPSKESSKGASKDKGKMGAKSSKGTSEGKTGKNHVTKERNQKLNGKKNGMRIGQKTSIGPLVRSGRMLVSKVRSVSAVLLQHAWQKRQGHLSRGRSTRRSWSS